MSKNRTLVHTFRNLLAPLAGVLASSVFLTASCTKEAGQPQATGTLSLSFERIAVLEGSDTKASVANVPSPADFEVTVTDGEGKIIFRGHPPMEDTQVPPGTYHAAAVYGSNPVFGQNTAYFTGSADCEVTPGRTSTLAVTAALANAQVIVACDPSLLQIVTVSSLTARVGGETYPVTPGEPFYVRAGSTLQIELTGSNDQGNAVSMTKTVPEPLAAKTQYTVNLKPVSFRMPQQYAGNIWCRRAYITPVSAADISASTGADAIAAKIAYELSADGGTTWTPAADIDGRPGWQNLTPGTDYLVRGKYGSIFSDNTATLTTASEIQIPNNTFAANYETSNGGQPCYWFFANGAAEADKWWATRNEMTTNEGINAKYTRYSGSRPLNPGIELVTCGWGSGNTASGSLSTVNNVSAGAVFLGSFGSKTENHGKAFDSRPTAMRFDYTYAPYNNNDRCVARIWLENREGGVTTKLAEGSFETGSSVSSYAAQTITLTYTNDRLPITHLCIAFYSGVNEGNSKYIKKPGFASNDPSRGSVMKVNNVQLIYNK